MAFIHRMIEREGENPMNHGTETAEAATSKAQWTAPELISLDADMGDVMANPTGPVEDMMSGGTAS